MTVYLDIIFLENLFMNYIIIYACEIILKLPIKISRTFLASLIGSLYAILLYMSKFKIYSNILLKLILSVVIAYVAFAPKSLKMLYKCLTIFYLTSFLFGGIAFAFLYFIHPDKKLIENGVLINTYPIKLIVAGGIFGFILITHVFKNFKEKWSQKDIFCEIKIIADNKQVTTKAIIDTGNMLHDPITKESVLVIEKNILEEIIPHNVLRNLNNILIGKEIELMEYSSKIRIIPFTSLGKENGMLVGIKIDKVQINMEENSNIINNIIAGIYDGILSKNGKYHALIGLDLISRNT